MRFSSSLLVMAVLASSVALTSSPAGGQAVAPAGPPPAWPACDGVYAIVRVDDIKPGQWKAFSDAVAAQQAWYKQKGLVDQIILERVIEMDPKTRTGKMSETSAITEHILGGDVSASRPQDDGYKAFTAMYTASSTIKSSYTTCIVK